MLAMVRSALLGRYVPPLHDHGRPHFTVEVSGCTYDLRSHVFFWPHRGAVPTYKSAVPHLASGVVQSLNGFECTLSVASRGRTDGRMHATVGI